MEYLQSLLDQANAPVWYAFILGLMTAISPCPLAMNITAVAFVGKDIENRKKIFINGLFYTLGRAISYSILGLILFFGASRFSVAGIFQAYGEKILGPLLLVIGILMLDVISIKLPSFSGFTNWLQGSSGKSSILSSLLLGIIFALAFCPYSAVLYFGMLIPLSISSVNGLYLPFVYAVATGLPVIIIAYILAFSISGIGNFYDKLRLFQKWLNRIVSSVFILVGLYYMYLYYVKIYLL